MKEKTKDPCKKCRDLYFTTELKQQHILEQIKLCDCMIKPNHLVCSDDQYEVWKLAKKGFTQVKIAKEFKITQSQVSKMLRALERQNPELRHEIRCIRDQRQKLRRYEW